MEQHAAELARSACHHRTRQLMATIAHEGTNLSRSRCQCGWRGPAVGSWNSAAHRQRPNRRDTIVRTGKRASNGHCACPGTRRQERGEIRTQLHMNSIVQEVICAKDGNYADNKHLRARQPRTESAADTLRPGSLQQVCLNSSSTRSRPWSMSLPNHSAGSSQCSGCQRG